MVIFRVHRIVRSHIPIERIPVTVDPKAFSVVCGDILGQIIAVTSLLHLKAKFEVSLLGEVEVAGHDGGALLVAFGDEVVEVLVLGWSDGFDAEVVHDEQMHFGQGGKAAMVEVGCSGRVELAQELAMGGKEHLIADTDGRAANRFRPGGLCRASDPGLHALDGDGDRLDHGDGERILRKCCVRLGGCRQAGREAPGEDRGAVPASRQGLGGERPGGQAQYRAAGRSCAGTGLQGGERGCHANGHGSPGGHEPCHHIQGSGPLIEGLRVEAVRDTGLRKQET